MTKIDKYYNPLIQNIVWCKKVINNLYKNLDKSQDPKSVIDIIKKLQQHERDSHIACRRIERALEKESSANITEKELTDFNFWVLQILCDRKDEIKELLKTINNEGNYEN